MNTKIMLDRLKKFNQIAYVEYLLDNSYLINDSKNYFSNLKLLTIYLRQIKNLKPKQREEFVYNFVSNYDNSYNKVLDYKRIDKALKAGTKGELKVFSFPKIYKNEFDYIDNLPIDISRKRVLFSAYCFYKLRNAEYPNLTNNIYVPHNIVSISKLKTTSKVKDNIRYYLNELKDQYLDWCPARNSSIVLKFVQNMPPEDIDTDFCEIINFDNLYLYYDYFLGDKSIAFCEDCGDIYRDKSYKTVGGRQKFCKNCTQKDENSVNYKKIICKNCKKESFISTKSRRKVDLCDECYEDYRKQDRHSTTSKK